MNSSVSPNVQISRNCFEALVPSRELVAQETGRNACATAQANIVFGSRLSLVRQHGTFTLARRLIERHAYSSVFVRAPDGQLASADCVFGAVYVARVAVYFEDVADAGQVEATEVVVEIVRGIECRKAADAFENLRIWPAAAMKAKRRRGRQ